RVKIDLDARLKDTISLRSQILNTMVLSQQQKLQKYLDQGATWKDIRQHDPEMFALLSQLFAAPGDQRLALQTTQVDAFASPTSELESALSAPFWEPRLGARLLQVGLTGEQWRVAQGRHHNVRQAFRVIEAEPTGPAAGAGVRVGDFI